MARAGCGTWRPKGRFPQPRLLANLKGGAATIVEPSRALRAISLSPNGKLLASGDKESRKIALWELNANRLLATFEGYPETVRATDFSPDGMSLASCSQDGSVRVWDISKFADPPAKAKK